MLLVLNTITDVEGRQRFSAILRDRVYYSWDFDVLHLDEEAGSLQKYTHLLISGSNLSAVEGSRWDEKIFRILQHFVKYNKAILGICYGHQILARYLAGEISVRTASKAQYGFRRIILSKNPIFKGMKDFYGMEAHKDEVWQLPPEFDIIAYDEEEVIQGFQLKGERFWGVQFHPEYNYFGGLASWQRRIRHFPQYSSYFEDKVPHHKIMEQNKKIFRNFINL